MPMSSWRERISKAISDREVARTQAEQEAAFLAKDLIDQQRALELQKVSDERQTAAKIAELLEKLKVKVLLQKTKDEAWRGRGTISRIGDRDFGGYRLAYMFNLIVVSEEGSGGGGPDGAGTMSEVRHNGLGITFTQVSIDFGNVSIGDGEFYGGSEDILSNKWRDFVRKGEDLYRLGHISLEDVRSKSIKINEFGADILEQALIETALRRVEGYRTPNDLSKDKVVKLK